MEIEDGREMEREEGRLGYREAFWERALMQTDVAWKTLANSNSV